jgi:hypothetical protein
MTWTAGTLRRSLPATGGGVGAPKLTVEWVWGVAFFDAQYAMTGRGRGLPDKHLRRSPAHVTRGEVILGRYS